MLELRFDPRTIEHLGIKMYSRLPFALAELIANGYDAAAESVEIKLYDADPDHKQIIIKDDGEGMSFEDVQNKFLIIGRKRRDEDGGRYNSKRRKITGRKGLGKLALFGIGKTIQIETTKLNEPNITRFTLNWDDILNETGGVYNPRTELIPKEDVSIHGTTITLSDLTRASDFNLSDIANSVSKLFNWAGNDFVVKISKNDSDPVVLTRDMRYEGLNKEFEWDIQEIISTIEDDYEHKNELKGKIISSRKPMRQDLRGITLYVNGRLANVPGFFGLSEAGHTFSYISGWIDADFLDEISDDVISTDRQSLNWDLPEAEALKNFLHKIIKFLVKDWSQKRKEAKQSRTSTRSGINIKDWVDNVPEQLRSKLQQTIEDISEKPEIEDEDFSSVVRNMYDLIPPYTYYHYRWLHPEIQNASQDAYKREDYYEAFIDAMKRYKNAVKDKANINDRNDYDLMSNAFPGKLLLKRVFHSRPNGSAFDSRTITNIQEGQKFLSMGIVQAGRNVVAHEEKQDLKQTGLFSEADCLDMLSLLSHLFKRLDMSELVIPESNNE